MLDDHRHGGPSHADVDFTEKKELKGAKDTSHPRFCMSTVTEQLMCRLTCSQTGKVADCVQLIQLNAPGRQAGRQIGWVTSYSANSLSPQRTALVLAGFFRYVSKALGSPRALSTPDRLLGAVPKAERYNTASAAASFSRSLQQTISQSIN
jgi:hypothetical protein